MTRSRSEASPTASGRRRPCQSWSSELCKGYSLGGSNRAHPPTWRCFRLRSERRRPPWGACPVGYRFFMNEPLQFEATTITRAHHPRVLHDGQDQRAARIFRDLETDRRAHDDRVRGNPSFTAASQSRIVGPSTAPSTTLSARAAANHNPVVNPSAVAQGPSTTPSPRSSCAAGGGTGASVGRYGQGAVFRRSAPSSRKGW